MSGQGTSVEILPLASQHVRAHFACAKRDLDEWLIRQAGQQERKHNTRTFVAVDPIDGQSVVGYYATSTYRLDLDEAASAFGVGKRRYPVPAVLLARLAVDKRWEGRGIGRQLLRHALTGIAHASRAIGFEVVVVHAIDDEAATFYGRYGFIRFEGHRLHLFLPTKDLLATMASS